MAKRNETGKPRVKEPKKRHRLPHGEGSFYYRDRDDRWVGTIEAGLNAEGRRRRIVVTHKDEDRAWDKLAAKRKILITQGRAAALQGSATVTTWSTKWLKIQEKSLRPSTYAGSASYVKKWIIPNCGKISMEDITADHVRKVSRAIIGAGLSSTTAATVQGVFQKMLRDAQIEGYQINEAALKAPRPKKEDTRKRTAIPLDQCWTFIDAAKSIPNGSRWIMAFIQGMRPAEILGLTWDSIDFEAGTVSVSWQLKQLPYKKKGDPKSGFRTPDGYEVKQLELSYHLVRPKSQAGWRTIPLIPWMAELLKEWRDNEEAPKSTHGLIWPRDNGMPQIDKADVKAWKRLQDHLQQWKEAPNKELEKDAVYWDSYEIRHSTATILLDAGVDPKIIEAILGHSDIVTTQGYQHVSQEMMRLALEAVAKKLRDRPEAKELPQLTT